MSVFLVTGGAGFIGSNTVHELVRRGHTVRVVDNLSTGHKQNLSEVWDSIEFIEGDILSAQTMKKVCEGADFVVHEAANVGVPPSVKDPISSNTTNVTGTLTVLVAARDAGVKRVVIAASAAAYGDQPGVMTEDVCPKPLSPYAVAKVCCEEYARVFNDLYGLQTVNLRYFNVFGPRQDPHSPYAAAIPLFINTMLSGKSPTVYGDGKQSRDFTYVQNNVDANILACTVAKVAGQTINIASGTSITVNQLVQMINECLGIDIEPDYTSERPGDIKFSSADIKKARHLLGFEPSVGVKDGIRRTIDWLRQHTAKPV